MSCHFDPQQGLIIVGAELWGPSGNPRKAESGTGSAG